ncbi:MarR family transcriptional regulator [Gallaecimonas sp. GXIMD4217]|uniref:MarR family winged helix-turn-helix transcriptional regulator n=1 Tax=Gallaecimonas sp. GXIMD4217 TaxID=3131927 RepID=UPI00311B0288
MDKAPCEALRLDNQLCFALYSTSLAMGKLYKPLLAELGLTYPQYLIMLVLWEQDGLTVTELSQRLGQDKGALSPVIKRLEAQGLLGRRRSPEDERRQLLCLTDGGLALRSKAEAVPRQLLCATGLSPDQARAMKAQLEQLRQSLQDLID